MINGLKNYNWQNFFLKSLFEKKYPVSRTSKKSSLSAIREGGQKFSPWQKNSLKPWQSLLEIGPTKPVNPKLLASFLEKSREKNVELADVLTPGCDALKRDLHDSKGMIETQSMFNMSQEIKNVLREIKRIDLITVSITKG